MINNWILMQISRSFLTSISCIVVVVFSSCENKMSDVSAMFPDVRPDAEVITNFETIFSDSATVKLKISGDELLRYEEDGQNIQVFTKGAFVEFYDEKGFVNSTLSSKYGIRYERDEKVIVRDSVVWRSIAGDQLNTEELIWDPVEKKLYSQRYVKLKKGRQIITGVGFESNEEFTRSEVRAVQGIVNVDRSKSLR